MLFLKDNGKINQVAENLEVFEYCNIIESTEREMDGAIAYFKAGSFGPKINKGFTELFFMLEGELVIKLEGETFNLKKDDLFIMPKNKKHILYGYDAKIFISCTPPFDVKKMEFL